MRTFFGIVLFFLHFQHLYSKSQTMGNTSSSATSFTKKEQHYPQMMGKIDNGRYIAYNHLFSIEIPNFAEPRYIEDDYHNHQLGGVVFFNDYGFLFKLEMDQLIPEVVSLITKHPEIKDEILDAIFYEFFLPQLQIDVPNLKVLHERKILLENGEPALFAVLDLPKASSIVDRLTGQSFDSKQGCLLVFSENRYLINFCMQDPYSLMPRFAETAKLHLKERLLDHLLKVQRTFKGSEEIKNNPRSH